jgi:hypothetical protein
MLAQKKRYRALEKTSQKREKKKRKKNFSEKKNADDF